MHKIITCVALLALLSTTSSAHADGAFAAGIKNNDASQGAAFGWSFNQANEGAAKYHALRNCLDRLKLPAELRAECKVVTTFRRQCFAISVDRGDGTPGWGWSVDSSKTNAEQKAVGNCRAIAGSGRENFCEMFYSNCDAEAVAAGAPSTAQLKSTLELQKPQSGGADKR